MSELIPHFVRSRKLGLILMIGVGLSGCSKSMEWEEEILLSDGQVIIAERHYSLGGYPTIQSRERAAIDETVTFGLPSGKKIIWKTDFNDTVPEPNGLMHIRFDIVKGIPYLVTHPAGCIAYNKWGRPNPPQVYFKYQNEQWVRISMAELPEELFGKKANVVVGKPGAEQVKSFYTTAQLNEWNKFLTPEYKTILREALPEKHLLESCPKLVRTGDGWKSLNWFTSQHSLGACLQLCERESVATQNCPCTKLFKGAINGSSN